MRVLRSLRIVVIAMLILLALQFELGMAVNLSPSLEDVPPLAGTLAAVWAALAKVGGAAIMHALLGSFLTIAALAGLAVRSGARSVAAVGIASFISIAMATLNGVLFTLSGFKNDHYSHGMATLFLVAFSLHFAQLGLVILKLRRRAAGEKSPTTAGRY